MLFNNVKLFSKCSSEQESAIHRQKLDHFYWVKGTMHLLDFLGNYNFVIRGPIAKKFLH